MIRAAWPSLSACLALAICALLLPACAEAPHGPLVGASDVEDSPREHARDLPRTPSAAADVWEMYAQVQHWPLASTAPFTSRGHPPEQTVEVRVNEAARASYANLVTDTVFPDGSVLVELSRGTGHSYAMSKSNGAWSYLELDTKGRLLDRGALGFCAACHAQAPADYVFGPARVP